MVGIQGHPISRGANKRTPSPPALISAKWRTWSQKLRKLLQRPSLQREVRSGGRRFVVGKRFVGGGGGKALFSQRGDPAPRREVVKSDRASATLVSRTRNGGCKNHHRVGDC
ncbi:hypothetical protein MRX96_005902 [Rhipicephalus microplus]